MAQSRFMPKLIGLLLATSSALAAQAAGTVNIYNWNDYIAKDTAANFEKSAGVKVRYDMYDSNETLQAKLLTGKSGYDVVHPSADFAAKQIQAAVYLPLDKSKLPNLANLNPEFLKKVEAIDPGNKFVVPYLWGTIAFGINTDKVKKALGNEAMPADMWQLVFDPKYTSKLKSCGISFVSQPKYLFNMVNIYHGKPANDFSKESIAAALTTLKAVRQDVRLFNDSPIDLLANGDVCVAMGYNGDVYIAKDRAAEAKKPLPIEYVVPAKGTMLWVDVMAVPKDSKNVDNAYKWINNILDPKVVAGISNTVNYANPNSKATPLVNKKLTGDAKIYPSDAVLKTLQTAAALDQPTTMALTKAFNQFKTAK